MDFAALMEQKLLRERGYMREGMRRSKSKTRPFGDGKTPDIFELWTSFDQEVEMFWSKISPRLAGVQCQEYPRRGAHQCMMSEETDVRSCFHFCIAEPVSAAARIGLEENLVIASASSVGISNADVGGFITKPKAVIQEEYAHDSDSDDDDDDENSVDYSYDFDEEVLPIEIKPPWQVTLLRSRNVVQMMSNDDEMIHVRSALSQIFLYMVLEQSKYGVLSTKDRSVFLRYSVDESFKRLEASRTICYNDALGVRKCFLFMLMESKSADICPLSQTWTTQQGEKWIPETKNKRQSPLTREKMSKLSKRRKEARTGQGQRQSGMGTADEGPSMEREMAGEDIISLNEEEAIISFSVDEDSLKMEGTSSTRSPFDEGHEQDANVTWGKSLKVAEINDLHLLHILKKSASHKVWKGEIEGEDVAIKLFDFFESLEGLNGFHTEVSMYKKLAALQGVCIPRLVDHGLTWGGTIGYLATSYEGPEVECNNLQRRSKKKIVEALGRIHQAGVIHGDIRASNILYSSRKHNFVVIDFEQSEVVESYEGIEAEMHDLKALLRF